ncbi:leucine-rich repeat and WD repeat-containing protein 1 [Bombina bombina]|uniref:leucine-rich repeat and WD repeat-containing protein 1 n=1 Tax=Bombina bombina TaxID=8345 RepID=UPI00235AB36B|nr:leucine-rich repeat and WD repeat-containing protein 1 [Bombina bombina]
MTKLTTDILLKNGLPKSTRLKDIKTLKLSKMNLQSNNLDPQLFSQMEKLEELDISKNLLSELPENLNLVNLRVLNFADNQVEEVTTLTQFPNLEELIYEENLYLTVSDNYKVFCLLPKLRRLNNKDITSLANHVRFVNHRELSNRVEAYWKNYKDNLLSHPSAEEIKAFRKNFMKSVVEHVQYGPNSLKDFTKWKVKMIAQDLLSSVLDNKEKKTPSKTEPTTKEDDTIQALGSPNKHKRDRAKDCTEDSPTKKIKTVFDIINTPLSPRRSNRLHESPLKCTPVKNKHNMTCKSGEDGLQKVRLNNTPSKKQNIEVKKQIVQQSNLKTSKRLEMEPLHFLQCHSKNNSCEDFKTQLWACAFEPNVDASSSRVVATCGGDSVCLIDCETGKVLKKYKVAGEEFFTLAWTTLTMVTKDGAKRKVNVLGAGGKLGTVKLIQAKVNFCYGEIKAHKKAISFMCFSPKHDTFLFTGSYDNRIILWDIGVPDDEYNFRASQLLTLDTTSTPLRMCPVPAYPDEYLLAACDKGCFLYDIKLNKQQGRRSHVAEFNFPIYKKENKEADYHVIDGMAFLNEDIVASKSSMQGSIYLWSFEKSYKGQKSKNRKNYDAVILTELNWSDTEEPYITLTTCLERCCVFCGDEAGKVWIYDLDSCKAEIIKGIASNGLKEPTKILQWPSLTCKNETFDGALINTVAVDAALQYLVVLTDKNIVSIWKVL